MRPRLPDAKSIPGRRPDRPERAPSRAGRGRRSHAGADDRVKGTGGRDDVGIGERSNFNTLVKRDQTEPAGEARGKEPQMGVTRPIKDKGEGDRDKLSPDVERASRGSESSTAEVQNLPDVSAPPPGETPRTDILDLPRNEAFRHGAVGGLDFSPRAGETAAQDIAVTEEAIQLEATTLRRSAGRANVDEWREAGRRLEPGIEDERAEATPVRGPASNAGTGRVVTERETVADDGADADATDRNAARQDDPDGI